MIEAAIKAAAKIVPIVQKMNFLLTQLCVLSANSEGTTMGSILALSVPGPKSAGVYGTPAHEFVTCMIKEYLDICVLTNKNVQVEVIYRQKMLDC